MQNNDQNVIFSDFSVKKPLKRSKFTPISNFSLQLVHSDYTTDLLNRAHLKHFPLFQVLLTLPEYLKKLLEIGPDYYTGELADKNEDSMYFQIKNIIKNGVKDGISRIFNFLKCW